MHGRDVGVRGDTHCSVAKWPTTQQYAVGCQRVLAIVVLNYSFSQPDIFKAYSPWTIGLK